MFTFAIAAIYAVSFLVCYWHLTVDYNDRSVEYLDEYPGLLYAVCIAPWIPGLNTAFAVSLSWFKD